MKGKPPVDRHNPPGEKCHAQVSYESRRNSRRLETLPILAVGEPTGPFIPVLAVDHGPKSHTGAARTCGPQEAGSQPTVDHVSFRGAFGRQFGCCQSDPIPRTHYTQHAKLKYSHNNEPFSLRHQAHHCCHRFRAAQHYRPTMQSSLFLQPSTQWPSTRSGPGHNARVTRQQLYSRPSGMRPRSHTNRFVDFIPAPQTFGPQAPFPSLSNVTRVPERRAV
ncbi:hypothetical protein BDW22DRAFT_1230284 [Trametopsis cervina]|nr:hypothetical protein BDW22DRAFT_1230284 [Trametopsis cervina]